MEKTNTAARLKEIMTEKNLKQIDILNLVKPYCEMYGVKMNKSDISQYVSGKVAPSQDKLVVLGMALDVSESWLMGMDTARSRQQAATDAGRKWTRTYLENKEVFDMYIALNEKDKETVKKIIISLYKNKA